jgi:hypothetical protein
MNRLGVIAAALAAVVVCSLSAQVRAPVRRLPAAAVRPAAAKTVVLDLRRATPTFPSGPQPAPPPPPAGADVRAAQLDPSRRVDVLRAAGVDVQPREEIAYFAPSQLWIPGKGSVYVGRADHINRASMQIAPMQILALLLDITGVFVVDLSVVLSEQGSWTFTAENGNARQEVQVVAADDASRDCHVLIVVNYQEARSYLSMHFSHQGSPSAFWTFYNVRLLKP